MHRKAVACANSALRCRALGGYRRIGDSRERKASSTSSVVIAGEGDEEADTNIEMYVPRRWRNSSTGGNGSRVLDLGPHDSRGWHCTDGGQPRLSNPPQRLVVRITWAYLQRGGVQSSPLFIAACERLRVGRRNMHISVGCAYNEMRAPAAACAKCCAHA